MESEARTFNGLGAYSLSYEYNLAGQLKKVTNPWGVEVSYGYDKAGRLTGVGGANYAGVTSYAGGLSYRAFGAVKGMNYGDGRSLSTAYDNRLRPTTWNVAGVMGWNYSYSDFNENTGRVTFAQSLNDATLDRSYYYDQVGRLEDVHTGAEARAALEGQGATPDGAYSHHYWYDQFGNMNHRVGWGGSFGGYLEQSLSFTNNRLNTNPFNGASMQYDQAGNLKNDGHQSFAYDATGQQTNASGSGAGGSAPVFTDDPLKNPENPESFKIKLIHLTQLREAVNGLRVRAGLPAITSWNPDPNPEQNVTTVKAEHIRQLRTKLEEALNALHLPVGSYEHPTLTENSSPIYAVDFQELRQKIKAAWTALANSGISQFYDGNGLRVKKTETGAATYYLRSSVLGGQVMAEISGGAVWQRGYVYAGGSLMAVQQGGVFWMHEDPVTKSKRVTDSGDNIVSTIDLDPWGGETNRSSNQAFQPQRYTTYTRDSNGGDDAMFRRYQSSWTRFAQPDPYDGSYDLGDPQSLNRYSYVSNDPVNFVDPSGTDAALIGLLLLWAQLNSGSWTVTVNASGSFTGFDGGDVHMVIDMIGRELGGGVGDVGGGGSPHNTVAGTNSGTRTGTVAEFPCTFNVKLTSNGLTSGELQAAKDEIQEIFGASNLGVVFGNARAANGGSVSLNIGTNFSAAGQALVNNSGGGTPNGIATLGRAYVSITNTVTLFGKVEATTSAIRALSVGRVAAHEITHGLGRRGEGSGLMRGIFGSELFDPNADAQFRLTASDAARLARRCRGRRR